jgi:hypothetical protein
MRYQGGRAMSGDIDLPDNDPWDAYSAAQEAQYQEYVNSLTEDEMQALGWVNLEEEDQP